MSITIPNIINKIILIMYGLWIHQQCTMCMIKENACNSKWKCPLLTHGLINLIRWN